MTQEEKLHDLELKFVKMDESFKSMHMRFNDIQKDIKSVNELAFSIHEIALEMKAMRADVNEVKTDLGKNIERVQAIEHKPAKKWEAIVDKILMVVVAGIMAYIMSHFGM